jgi:acyl-CoA synthetase (AMP-forming)/AMP-acid ligase II
MWIYFLYFIGSILLGALYSWGHLIPYLLTFLKLKSATKGFASNSKTVADMFEERLKIDPEKDAIVFEGMTWSYAAVDRESNRVANWALSQKIKKGDAVALVMNNDASYIFIWLGVSKIGGIVAMVNPELKGKSLLHSVRLSNAKTVIVGGSCMTQFAEVLNELDPVTTLWTFPDDVPHSLRPGPNNPKSYPHHPNNSHFLDDVKAGTPSTSTLSLSSSDRALTADGAACHPNDASQRWGDLHRELLVSMLSC